MLVKLSRRNGRRKWRLGLIIEPVLSVESIKLPPKDVPESFTLLRYVPPPRDQGKECAMCSAYASVLALETWLAYSKGVRVDLYEEEVFFCSGGDCKLGNSLTRVLEYMRLRGVHEEPGRKRMRCEKGVGNVYRCDPKPIPPDPETIKRYLINGVPVVIAAMVGERSFLRYRWGVYRPGRFERKMGHAMTVIGYSDSVKAFLCRNSFGPEWGIGGDVWIGYDYPILQAFAINDLEVVEPRPSLRVEVASFSPFGVLRIRTDKAVRAVIEGYETVIMPPEGYVFLPSKPGIHVLKIYDEEGRLLEERKVAMTLTLS